MEAESVPSIGRRCLVKEPRRTRTPSKRQRRKQPPPVGEPTRPPRSASLLEVLMHDETVHQMMDSRGTMRSSCSMPADT